MRKFPANLLKLYRSKYRRLEIKEQSAQKLYIGPVGLTVVHYCKQIRLFSQRQFNLRLSLLGSVLIEPRTIATVTGQIKSDRNSGQALFKRKTADLNFILLHHSSDIHPVQLCITVH